MKDSVRNSIAVAVLLGSSAIFSSAALAAKPPAETEDGLLLTKSKRVDLLYKRPGASLKGYTKVWLKPMSVSFCKAWNPKDYGQFGISAADVQRIRDGVSELVFETMTEQLNEAKYTVVSGPGEGVLEVEGELVNLYVAAPMPEKRTGAAIKSYVLDPNELTLVAEVRDSLTGTVLARGLDRRKGVETGQLQWATSGLNKADAKFFAKQWAITLIKALDAAKEEAK
jgi:hypothetical protein